MTQNFNVYKELKDIYCMSTKQFEKEIGFNDGSLEFSLLIPNGDNNLIEDLPGIRDFLRVQRVKLIKVFVEELIERSKQISTMKSLSDARLEKTISDYKTYVEYVEEIYKDMGFDKTVEESVLLFCENDTYEYKKYREASKIVEEIGN